PRFAHELDLPAEIPAPFLAGQFANVEFQDMLTILQEEGGAYIRDNHPSYWAHSQHVIPFWMWLGGTLDASEVDYQPLLDNMITTYVDHYEDQLTGLLDAPRSEG